MAEDFNNINRPAGGQHAGSEPAPIEKSQTPD